MNNKPVNNRLNEQSGQETRDKTMPRQRGHRLQFTISQTQAEKLRRTGEILGHEELNETAKYLLDLGLQATASTRAMESQTEILNHFKKTALEQMLDEEPATNALYYPRDFDEEPGDGSGVPGHVAPEYSATSGTKQDNTQTRKEDAKLR